MWWLRVYFSYHEIKMQEPFLQHRNLIKHNFITYLISTDERKQSRQFCNYCDNSRETHLNLYHSHLVKSDRVQVSPNEFIIQNTIIIINSNSYITLKYFKLKYSLKTTTQVNWTHFTLKCYEVWGIKPMKREHSSRFKYTTMDHTEWPARLNGCCSKIVSPRNWC